MMKQVKTWRGLAFVSAIILAIVISGAVIMEAFRTAIDTALHTQSSVIESDDDGTLWSAFTPPKEVLNADGTGNSQALIKKFIEFGRRQGAESATLLKNEEYVAGKPALPLKSGSSVTLFGMRSYIMLQGAAMGMPIKGPVINLAEALGGTKTNFTADINRPAGNGSFVQEDFNFADVGGAGAGYELN